MLVLFASLLVCLGAAGLPHQRQPRDVKTSQGTVRGYLVPSTPPHYAYLGIPYARPARLDRFKAPQPAKPWDGIFEATHRVKCLQPNGVGTEDCLVINVFSPQQADTFPVLVIIHGGHFQSGWGAFRPPTRLLAKDFVIVTFNYRVGVFGFLCLGSQMAPGNAGLKDQIAALYWIHRNIAQFGGNPYDVTLHGLESGAASVQMLLMSGLTKGLVHKVIIESGSVLSPLSLSYDPMLTAMDVAVAKGYRGKESVKELVAFYGRIPSKSLVNITSLFLPCVESNIPETSRLIDNDPLLVMNSGNYQMLPMLIAFSDTQGLPFIHAEFSNVPDGFEYMLPNNLKFHSHIEKTQLAELVTEFYVGKPTFDRNLTGFYADYINDVIYKYPIIKSAVIYAATNSLPVYMIKLSNNRSGNKTKDQLSVLEHFDEENQLTKSNEMKVTQLILLWSNFIKIGDPTPLLTFLMPMVWQPLQTNIQRNQTDIKVVSGLMLDKSVMASNQLCDERTTFWDHVYKKFYRPYSIHK